MLPKKMAVFGENRHPLAFLGKIGYIEREERKKQKENCYG